MKQRYSLNRMIFLLGVGCLLTACSGKTMAESGLGLNYASDRYAPE